jgi:hypothetical protein
MVLEFGRDIDRANADPFGQYLCQAMVRVDQHARTLHHSVAWKGAQPWLTRVLEVTGLDAAPAVADRQFA